MSLQDICIAKEYRTLSVNMSQDFYIPLLKEAISYKRAVGFFSSTVLIGIAEGIFHLHKNGGHIQLIASPKLSEEDIVAINKGYQEREQIIQRSLERELQDVEQIFLLNRLNLLANLIANNILDLRIAVVQNSSGIGMYHEKLGLIEDIKGNIVAFSGSMNESANALEANYESVDVFCSWYMGDVDRVQCKKQFFEKIWSNTEENIQVYEFPEFEQKFVEKYQKSDLAIAVYKEEQNEYVLKQQIGFIQPETIRLYDYQLEAIQNWQDNGYCGIFDMATGTGKTFTGLGALTRLSQFVSRLAVIIVCPYQHLVDQWVEDIQMFGVLPIVGHSNSKQKNYKQRLQNAVFAYQAGQKNFFTFICTNATFRAKWVQAEIEKLTDGTVLMVDEAHNFGTEALSKTLQKNYKYRLALSATLDRHCDEEGTKKLRQFFGKTCIEYGLERAIAEGKLVPYDYHPVIVYLTEDELHAYQKITLQISRQLRKKNGKFVLTDMAKMLFIKRARIVAGAKNKLEVLREVMKEHREENYMLVYCGAASVDIEANVDEREQRQIDAISKMLNFDLDMRTAQFTSREDTSERKNRIEEFKNKDIQALVAIKCLDEGMNIPEIRTAFILASTTNPKEYVQRRGRVLRRAKGKEKAVIYDFITLPRPLDDVMYTADSLAKHELSLVKHELCRMMEFRDLAKNFYEADRLIDEIQDVYHLYDWENNITGAKEWEDEFCE